MKAKWLNWLEKLCTEASQVTVYKTDTRMKADLFCKIKDVCDQGGGEVVPSGFEQDLLVSDYCYLIVHFVSGYSEDTLKALVHMGESAGITISRKGDIK